MSFDLKKHKNNLLFIPLGGTNEIGINVNLYHYQGKWIMIDCGSGFPEEYLPGADMLVADLSFIEQHRKNLLALILTHAHEDHIGAVPYLWNQLQCPIYTTTFTVNLLKTKLTGFNLNKVKIHTVKPSSKIDLSPFVLEMLPLTHSAPEMQAIMIKTDAGNILHTGDWKFDHDPVIGSKNNEQLLKAYGDKGVLALTCDSTNVFDRGTSGSEGDLRKSLVQLIKACNNMVLITTFASNVARLDTLIHAAKESNRKVVLAGLSLHRVINAAQESGYLLDADHLIAESDISKFKREQLLILTTGCQAEPLAALTKIVNGNHSYIKLAPSDTVIFSSKIIPGNTKKIFRLYNALMKLNVEVITERDHFVHVSGHPAIEELTKMHTLVRPQICIPVHGEAMHIHQHAKLAKQNNINHTIEVENGNVVLLDPESPRIISSVTNGYLVIDGKSLIPDDSIIFKMRRRMRDAGIVVASLVLSKSGNIITKPILSMPGLLDQNDEQLMSIIRQSIMKNLTAKLDSVRGNISDEQIENTVRNTIRKQIKNDIGKLPMIIVNIERSTV